MRKKIYVLFFVILLFLSINSYADSIEVSGKAALVIEDSTNKILYEKDIYEKMYPASTTKLMTALLTLEHGNLSDTTTVSKEAVNSLSGGYITPYIAVGEKLTIEQLLNVLLVPSRKCCWKCSCRICGRFY